MEVVGRIWAALALSCAMSVAISAQARPQSGIRDSAGIRIVVAAAKLWPNGAEWRVDSAPATSIAIPFGGTDLQALARFLRGGVVMNGGTIAVAVGTPGVTGEIRRYDVAGRLLSRTGQIGQAAGQFRELAELYAVRGDSLAVYDPRLDRLSTFSPNGTYVRTEPLSTFFYRKELAENRKMRVVGALNHEFLALATPITTGRPVPGRADQVDLYAIYDVARRTVDTVGRFAGMPYTNAPRGPHTMHILGVPFTVRPPVASGNGRLWVGIPDHDEIRAFDVNRRLTLIIRGARPVRAVTADDRTRWLATQRNLEPGDAALFEYPATMAAFRELHVDRLGNLWVRRYLPPWETTTDMWDVHDTSGRWLGSVTLPSLQTNCNPRYPFGTECRKILDIGNDYLLLSYTDADTVRVYRHRLMKPSSPRQQRGMLLNPTRKRSAGYPPKSE
jgi:hypothetical protein